VQVNNPLVMDLEDRVDSQSEPRPRDLSQDMMDEIHDHLVYVLKEKLHWFDASNPEMAMGSGHVVIRFEHAGERYVFRVAKHGVQQHKRSMLAYQLVGSLGIIPEKIYHDGISLLERHVDGAPMTAQMTDAVLVQFATKLDRLHAMPAQGFGWLDFDTQAAFVNANAYYQAQRPVGVDWSEADLTDDQLAQLNGAILNANVVPTVIQNVPVQLGHGDLWHKNVIVTPTDFKILDWDHIGAYPIERDLAFLLVIGFNAEQRRLFFTHYSKFDVIKLEAICWFAKRNVLRDRELRLDKKLHAISVIDSMTRADLLGLR
jgi:hypothetical protein